MTIDAWLQHPNSKMLNHPMFETLRRWMGELPDSIPIEETVRAMDEAGVKQGLLCAWHGPDGPLISNDEVREHIARYPDRFIGVAAADLRNPVAAMRNLRSLVRQDGFKALRVVQWVWERPCTDPLYYPLLAECVELDIPVCLQVGLTGPLRTSETGRPLHIERIALDFPDLKIVCGHIGYPWHVEMIAFATKFPNVYIDTSAYKCKRYPAELVAYMNGHGKHKVMFGSNFPMITPAACLEGLDALGLSETARDLFLSGNARRVFKLD